MTKSKKKAHKSISKGNNDKENDLDVQVDELKDSVKEEVQDEIQGEVKEKEKEVNNNDTNLNNQLDDSSAIYNELNQARVNLEELDLSEPIIREQDQHEEVVESKSDEEPKDISITKLQVSDNNIIESAIVEKISEINLVENNEDKSTEEIIENKMEELSIQEKGEEIFTQNLDSKVDILSSESNPIGPLTDFNLKQNEVDVNNLGLFGQSSNEDNFFDNINQPLKQKTDNSLIDDAFNNSGLNQQSETLNDSSLFDENIGNNKADEHKLDNVNLDNKELEGLSETKLNEYNVNNFISDNKVHDKKPDKTEDIKQDDGFNFFNNTNSKEDEFDFFNQDTNKNDPSANFFDSVTKDESVFSNIPANNSTINPNYTSEVNQQDYTNEQNTVAFFDDIKDEGFQQFPYTDSNQVTDSNYYDRNVDYQYTNPTTEAYAYNNQGYQYNNETYQYTDENGNNYYNQYYEQDYNQYEQQYDYNNYNYNNTEQNNYDPNYQYTVDPSQTNLEYNNQTDSNYYDPNYHYNQNDNNNYTAEGYDNNNVNYTTEGYDNNYEQYYSNYNEPTQQYNQNNSTYNTGLNYDNDNNEPTQLNYENVEHNEYYNYQQGTEMEMKDSTAILPNINSETNQIEPQSLSTNFENNEQSLALNDNLNNQEVYINQQDSVSFSNSNNNLNDSFINYNISETTLNDNNININKKEYKFLSDNNNNNLYNNNSNEYNTLLLSESNEQVYNNYELNETNNNLYNTKNIIETRGININNVDSDFDDLVLNNNNQFDHQNGYLELNNINEPHQIPLPLSPPNDEAYPSLSINDTLLNNNNINNDDTDNDRHGRKPYAIFSFGFGGKVISMIPKTVERFDNNNQQMITKLYHNNISIINLKDINNIELPLKVSNNFNPLLNNCLKPTESEIQYVQKIVDDKINILESSALHLSPGSGKQQAIGNILLWNLIKLILNNNGKIENINEQLKNVLKMYLNDNNNNENNNEVLNTVNETKQIITPQIKQLLLIGKRKEAAEFAMQKNNWAHALIIASCAGKETWQEVVNSFIKTEINNDDNQNESLAMIYNLFSGMGKTAINNLDIENWIENWIEKLCMILANRTPNDNSVLCSLGDQLMKNKLISAAHLCYLLSPKIAIQGGFETVGLRMMLLSAEINNNIFYDTESFLLTEIFEFALKLDNTNNLNRLESLNFFQAFKFNRAVNLVEFGELEAALSYCNYISEVITQTPNSNYLHKALSNQIINLKSRIQNNLGEKFNDSTWVLKKPTLNSFMSVMEGKINQLVMGDEVQNETSKNKYEIQAGPTVFRNGLAFSPQNPFALQPNLMRRSNSNEVLPEFYKPNLLEDDMSGRRSASPNLMSSPFGHSNNNSSPLLNYDNNGNVNQDGLFSPINNSTFTPMNEHNYQPTMASPLKTQVNNIQDEDDLGLGNTKTPKKVQVDKNESTITNPKEEVKQESKSTEHSRSKSYLGGFFSSFFGSSQTTEKKVYKAKLGEENSFYYDEVQKRWVNKAAGTSTTTTNSLPPPPRNTPKTVSEKSDSINPSPMVSNTNSNANTPFNPTPPLSGANTPPPPTTNASRGKKTKGKARYVDIFNQ